jgi:RNA polymerase sigma-70 factor (ECF subfamily)
VPLVTPAEQRLEALAREHGGRVLAYLSRRTNPAEEAADVYQEALVVAWRRIHTAPEDAAVELGWLLAIARRTLANHRRGRVRRLAATERLRAEVERASVPPAEEPDEHDAVRAALDRLSPTDREVITLTYWDGLTAEQVATVLEIAPTAVRKRLERARARLGATLAVPQRVAEAVV